MDRKTLRQMVQITGMAYHRTRQDLARVIEEERALRAELAQLQKMQTLPQIQSGQDIARAASGADVLWQGWLARNRSMRNMALARVLALKAHHQAQTRKAFGKHRVAQDLLAKEDENVRKKRQSAALDQAIETAIRFNTAQ